MSGQRLDQALAARGLARSRTHAARLVDAGAVRVNGHAAAKSSTKVGPDDVLTVESADHYVSRAAHKLAAALDAFAIDPAGRACLDVGASTGGFTQVLLERDARHVVALDVGHDQLDDRLAADPRVTLLEGVNARDLSRERLDALLASSATGGRPRGPAGEGERDALLATGAAGARPRGSADDDEQDVLLASRAEAAFAAPPRASRIELVVADLSFISLGLVLGPMRATVAEAADFVLLIKPQFEVGRQGVRDGLVTDRELARRAVERVAQQAFEVGLGTLGLIPSPIAGTHGNREYVAHFAVGGPHPTEWTDRIRDLTKGVRA